MYVHEYNSNCTTLIGNVDRCFLCLKLKESDSMENEI